MFRSEHLAIQKLHGIFPGRGGVVGEARVVPAEILLPARIGRRHEVTGIGGEVEKRMPEDSVAVVARGELSHRIVHVLVLFVLHLEGHDGQPVEEKDEIDFLMGIAEGEVRPEGDPILVIKGIGDALARPGPGIEQPEFQAADLEPMPEDHPERGMFEFAPQRLENLLPRIGAVIGLELFQSVLLGCGEKGPEMIFGDAVFRIRDLGLFEGGIPVFAVKVGGDVLLKGQFGWFLLRHG